MNIKENYRNNPTMLQLIGETQLAELERDIKAASALDCPFCGGNPEVSLYIIYGQAVSVSVACKACRIGTPRLIEGMACSGNNYTLQDRLQEAITLWNRRT